MMLLRSYRISPLEPLGPVRGLCYAFFRGLFRIVLRTIYHLSFADVAPLPDTGAVIVSPNHRSYLDPLVVGAAYDRHVYFMMSSKYYDMPLLNWFFRNSRCIPVDEESGNRSALRGAREVLDAGHVLAIFPEGHISPDGELQPGQPGVAWLARKTGAQVVPMHIGGTREALQRDPWALRASRVTVRAGEPLSIGDFADGREGNARFTDVLMERIAALDPAAS